MSARIEVVRGHDGLTPAYLRDEDGTLYAVARLPVNVVPSGALDASPEARLCAALLAAERLREAIRTVGLALGPLWTLPGGDRHVR